MKYVNFPANDQKNFMREVKIKSGLTWNSISECLGVTKGMLYCYLRGDSKISNDNYKLLCNLAGIEVSMDSFVIIKNKAQEISLPKKISSELAEFLGILAGDGHISGTNYHISVTCHRIDDCEYSREYISKLFFSLFKIRAYIRVQLHNNTIKCVVNSKKLFEYLVTTFKVPVGKKKEKLRIPKQILSNNKLLSFYLRGLFDTDGSVYLRRKKGVVVSICSRYPQFMENVRLAFIQLGFHPSVSGKNLYLYRHAEVERFFNHIGSSNLKHLGRYDTFINKILER